MAIVKQLNLWFKFNLIFVSFKLSPLEPPEYLEEKRLIKDSKGNYLGILDETVEFNLKVFSMFDSEFICEYLATMEGSYVQWCFYKYLFPLLAFLADNFHSNDSLFEGCTCG